MDMPAEVLARVAAGEPVWNTTTMTEEFEVIGFLAPFVVVRRRSDEQTGSLQFTHSPRWYFDWRPDSE